MNPIGKIEPSIAMLITPAVKSTGELFGVMVLLNSLLKVVFAIAGLYAFLNLILAGYAFLSSGGDPKAIAKAMDKIYFSLIGLIIIVCSFLLATIIGVLLFGDATAIIQPKL